MSKFRKNILTSSGCKNKPVKGRELKKGERLGQARYASIDYRSVKSSELLVDQEWNSDSGSQSL